MEASDNKKFSWQKFFISTASVAVGITLGLTIYHSARWAALKAKILPE